MDAPPIQYCKTTDDVSIAYAIVGEGTPLVLSASSIGRLHLYLRGPDRMVRLQDQLAAEGFCSLTYDGRGSGFSDRNRLDFSLDARLRDLEAVVRAAAFDRFVLVVPGTGASAALLFAHRHAEKVSHFVMLNPLTRSSALESLSSEWRLSRGLQSAAQDD